jgi:hypothetical protein
VKARLLLSIVSTALLAVSAPQAFAAPQPLVELAQKKDFLGLRILTRRYVKANLPANQWNYVRSILQTHPEIGTDIIYGWEQTGHDRPGLNLETEISTHLKRGDEQALSGNHQAAYAEYHFVAKALQSKIKTQKMDRSLGRQSQTLYPYVLQETGRALYAMGQFPQALEVYSWIQPNFPRYRQVLFERMWAAFRAGNIQVALGSIASQRSAYFSHYLEPEAYLVQIYLYQVLCRTADLQLTLSEIERYRQDLHSGKFGYREWARSDLETRTLLQMVETDPFPADNPTSHISVRDRRAEQVKILQSLQKRFEAKKRRLLEDLDSVVAYSKLAATPGMGGELKPIQKIKGREELLKKNLEIWPADSMEEWADEIGHHQFIGESLCSSQ